MDPRAEAIPGATVELQTVREHAKVSATSTDGDGNFTLPTPPTGEYSLRVLSVRLSEHRDPGSDQEGAVRCSGRLVVRLDIPGDCTCGDACVSKADQSRNVEPKCLMERSKVSLMRAQPPNNGLS